MPPTNVKRYRLESTGIPAGPHGQHQRALGDVARDMSTVEGRLDALEAGSYTPGDSSDWAAPAPTTIAEALDRIAAAVATAHGAIP
jgi:hypothetical protein